MKVSENNPESPHPVEIKRMCKQCVQGTSPFSLPVYEANKNIAHTVNWEKFGVKIFS